MEFHVALQMLDFVHEPFSNASFIFGMTLRVQDAEENTASIFVGYSCGSRPKSPHGKRAVCALNKAADFNHFQTASVTYSHSFN
jgi:hypothetical protein